MSPNKTAPSPRAREASTTTAERTPFSGGPYEVGVELEDVGPALEKRRATANRCARQPPRSVCFLVEDCKWCRPNTNTNNTQSDRGTLPEQEETPAVRALRECLATSDRDRRAAESRRTSCLDTVIERYVARRKKSA